MAAGAQPATGAVGAVGAGAATEVLTVIGHGPRTRAHLISADGERVEQLPPPTSEPATGTATAHGRRAARLEIETPNPLLADGIVLIDTSGIGARGSGAAAPTVDAPADLLRDRALNAVREWRACARHPLADQLTGTACRVAARSAEGVLAELASRP